MQPTALITGASSGMGRSLALRLGSRLTYKLALLGRNVNKLKETQQLLKQNNSLIQSNIYTCDLNDSNNIKTVIDEICINYGPLYVLINNAGIANSGKLNELDLNVWDSMIDTNLKGPIHIIYNCLKYLIDSSKENKNNLSCAIINIGSVSALDSNIGKDRSVYAASKYGIRGFSHNLFEDIRDYGIKVSQIHPHFTNTPIIDYIERNKGLIEYKELLIQCNDICDTVEYILNSSKTCCPTEIILRTQIDLRTKL